MEMFIIPLGTCNCPYETVAPGVHDGQLVKLPVPSYLVKLDDGKNLLVDTGMSRLHITDPAATWRGTPMEKSLVPEMGPADDLGLRLRLQELDVKPTDIEYVINTHLHFDHAGNNDLFERATFFVQREHYDYARVNTGFPHQYWNLPKLKYELLDGESALFPGIEILLTPGHVPSHQSVMVRLQDTGNMVVCGDAIYTRDNLDHDSWTSQADPVAAKQSGEKLKRVAADENATLLFGHDPAQAKQFYRSPQSYR